MLREAARAGLSYELITIPCHRLSVHIISCDSLVCALSSRAEMILQKQLKEALKCWCLSQFTDMMYLEKALLHLLFLQAAMLMIDKTFKGSKLICLLLAGLIGHTCIHPTKSAVCFSTRVSLGAWTASQDSRLYDKPQFSGCSTEY